MLNEGRSAIVPFCQLYTYSMTASTSRTQDMAIPGSAMGTRVSTIGDNYLHWRLRRLRVESVLSCVGTLTTTAASGAFWGNGIVHAIAFAMVDSSKLASTPTLTQASQLPCFSLGGGTHKLRFSVPQNVLMRDGGVPWFETQATGSESAAFQIPAFVWSNTTFSNTITTAGISQYVVVTGEIEFRDPVDATVSLTRALPPPSDRSVCDDDDDFKDYVEWKKWRDSRKGSIAAVAPP